MSNGEQNLREMLLGALERSKGGLGMVARLSPLFREKSLHGRLLAVVFWHLPILQAQLASETSLESHRFENLPAATLSEREFRKLLAHYYRRTIITLESEHWPEEVLHGPDQAFLKHSMAMRNRELVEMAATMIELETENPAAHKVTPEQASAEHLAGEMSRLFAEQRIAFRGLEPGVELRGVISRVRLAFILTLINEEAQSRAANTLLGFLQQIEALGQSGIDARLLGRLWLLPSEIPHGRMESGDAECPGCLDFTSLQAIVGRWRDLLLASYPQDVAAQLRAGNWNSALRLLKGNPHLLGSLKNQIMEMIRLQMPFAEILEETTDQQRLGLPFGMGVVFREGPLPLQTAVGAEILSLLGSQSDYPLLFFWQEHARRKGCLEVVDAGPKKTPANGAGHQTAAEMVLLRVFCQAWGIAGQPSAEDFANPRRLLETGPCRVETDAGIVTEIQAALDLHSMSTALTRVENALDGIVQQLPHQHAEDVRKNVYGLRRLMKRAGVRKAGTAPAGNPPVSS